MSLLFVLCCVRLTHAPYQSHSVPIPDKIADSNLIIEAVVPGGIRKTLTYFANSLLLSVQPSVGQLQVLERPAAQGALLSVCVCMYVCVELCGV